ncbi:enolase 4 [Diretmus argenteus]
MEERDIIRKSNSEYASPLVLCWKKNGKPRLCTDFRWLNARTVKDAHPLPHQADVLAALGGNAFFSTLDLTSGYYNVPLHEDDKKYTAVSSPLGLHELAPFDFDIQYIPGPKNTVADALSREPFVRSRGISSAAVSSDCGLPKETSLDLSGGRTERTDHVTTSLQWIDGPLSNMLKGLNPCDQTGVDDILRYCKKGKNVEKPIPPWDPPEPALPGSSAIGSVSLAVAKTGAQTQGIPLYKHIAILKNKEVQTQFHIPVALVTLLSCGKMSPGKLNLLEEVILVPKAGQRVKQITTMALELQKEMMRIMSTSPKAVAARATSSDTGSLVVGYERPEQPLDLITEACGNLGLALGTEIHLAVNCAAHELMDYAKGKYDVATGGLKSPDELVDLYQALISKYPGVVALIDPLRKEDVDQWAKLSSVIGHVCLLLSDTNSKPQAPPPPGVRGQILKQINRTSVSDLIRITSEHQGAVIMGTTCSEPCSDDSLSDVAVGLGMSYVKLGGLSGGERLNKYNRLISIEEELAQQGILVCQEKPTPPLCVDKPDEQSADVLRDTE